MKTLVNEGAGSGAYLLDEETRYVYTEYPQMRCLRN